MRLDDTSTDKAVLAELGARLRARRLARNVSQAQLAKEAGIGRVTLQRIEDGQSTSTTNLIKLLRALDLLEELESLLPEATASPLDQLRRRDERRQRAGSPRSPKPAKTARPWRWGDEERGRDE